jgi:hypothetical protein
MFANRRGAIDIPPTLTPHGPAKPALPNIRSAVRLLPALCCALAASVSASVARDTPQ